MASKGMWTTMDDGQSKASRSWDESGRYWDKHGQTIRAMFEPISIALIDACKIRANDSVLDVAAGIGEPSLLIANKILHPPEAIQAILDCLGLPSRAPPITTATEEKDQL